MGRVAETNASATLTNIDVHERIPNATVCRWNAMSKVAFVKETILMFECEDLHGIVGEKNERCKPHFLCVYFIFP